MRVHVDWPKDGQRRIGRNNKFSETGRQARPGALSQFVTAAAVGYGEGTRSKSYLESSGRICCTLPGCSFHRSIFSTFFYTAYPFKSPSLPRTQKIAI